MSGTVGWSSAEVVNWDEVSTEAPPPLPAGLYNAVIAQAEPTQTKEKKPAIKLQLQVIGHYAGDSLKSPKKVFDNATLIVEAAFRVKQLAASAGVEPPANFGIDAVKAFCDALCESEPLVVRLKQDTYQGKTNNKVDRYFTAEQAKEAAAAGEQPSGGGDTGAAAPRRRRGAAA